MIELLTANTPNGKKISIMREEICFEYKVKKLERIRIINIKLDIPRGKWRYLTVDEVKFLKKL